MIIILLFMQDTKPIQRRLHTISEDNIKVTKSSSYRIIKRPRLNTMNIGQQPQQVLINKNKKMTIEQNKKQNTTCKYYETKLNISCQFWCVFDVKLMQYKRGWRPKMISEYNGLSIIIVMKVYLQILQKHQQIQQLSVKIRIGLLKSQQKKKKVNQLNKLMRIQNQEQFTLAQYTIISFKDLLRALLMVNKQDLLQYSFIYLAYILAHLTKDEYYFVNNKQLQVQPQDKNCNKYMDIFRQYINKQLKEEYYQNTKFTQNMDLYSNPIEIAKIFANLIIKYPTFITMLQKKQIVIAIKYNMGYKFYEDRKQRFISERNRMKNHLMICNRSSNHFSVISYNFIRKRIIVLCESRFGMAQIDIEKIQQWLQLVTKPIIGENSKSQKSKLLPLLKAIQ